jgi:hypothetical protein
MEKMFEDGVHTRIMADRLGRNEATVKATLAKHFYKRNKASLDDGPQALSPEEEDANFQSRLLAIWGGLISLSGTHGWNKTLLNTASESWLRQITENTPKGFKSILASHHSPDVARLESLE